MLTIPTHIVPGEMAEKLKAIAEIGFEAIDLSLSDVAHFDGPLDELTALVERSGLKIASLGPVPSDASVAVIKSKIDMAKSLSAARLILDVTALVPLDLPKSDDVALALRPTRATEAGVLEYIAEHNEPNIGLALNAFEVLGDGSRPARLRDLDGASIFHVALWDGANQPMLPGQGTLNLGGLARVLARSGYRGPWSVGATPEGRDTLRNAYRSLLTVLSDAAETELLLQGATPDLPAKVPANGFEFIEFAVDEASAAELEAVLTSMAFRRERKHRSKQLALWRQGAVNIVINREVGGHAAQALADHGPCVCDMGLRVQDAAETVARAKSLGTQDFTQSVGLGELKIPAVRGVGGSVIHFIDERSDLHRVWDIEFEPTSISQATPPANLRRIDHVAQTMRYDEMQSWMLYYLTTFEMKKSPIVNVSDPSGIVRSQAIETPEGEVRFNLNGAADSDTLAGSFVSGRSGAGVQHIAFQTDDIFETSTLLLSSGFERLPISQNYYADTQAEFGLDGAATQDLRIHNLLYDEDAGGAYYQLYGQSIFDGFFFEIVQRKGRYMGYGARNASVRLASQLRSRLKQAS